MSRLGSTNWSIGASRKARFDRAAPSSVPEALNMTADIVDFPTHRFTTADLEHLEKTSESMIVSGIWASCERHTNDGKNGPGFDQWLVYMDANSDAAFAIARRSTGRYFLTDARSGASIVSGRTVQDVTLRWVAFFSG